MSETTGNPVTGEFTWQVLGSYTGAVAATILIMRALSTVEFLARVPPAIEGYIIALLILIGADVFLPPPPTTASLVLCAINAFGVSITAVGGNTLLGLGKKPPEK